MINIINLIPPSLSGFLYNVSFQQTDKFMMLTLSWTITDANEA